MKCNIPSSLGQLEGSEDEVEVEKFSLIRTLIQFGPEKKNQNSLLWAGSTVAVTYPTSTHIVLNKLFFQKHALIFLLLLLTSHFAFLHHIVLSQSTCAYNFYAFA